jgi:hypothetical protein
MMLTDPSNLVGLVSDYSGFTGNERASYREALLEPRSWIYYINAKQSLSILMDHGQELFTRF